MEKTTSSKKKGASWGGEGVFQRLNILVGNGREYIDEMWGGQGGKDMSKET